MFVASGHLWLLVRPVIMGAYVPTYRSPSGTSSGKQTNKQTLQKARITNNKILGEKSTIATFIFHAFDSSKKKMKSVSVKIILWESSLICIKSKIIMRFIPAL